MTDLILWLLSAETVGLASFPLVFRAFPRLADRGFGLAIPAGMLVVGTVMWLLSYIRVLPNDAWAWWLVVLLVAVGGAFAVRRHVRELRKFLRERWTALVMAQAVFLVFFALFALMRANDPNITNTEKPMEILMLNAAMSADSAPPEDPWLAGETVAYYYGGYWNLGGIGTLSDVPGAKAFNLSLALLAAMSAGAVFSLVYSMTSRDGAGVRAAAVSGIGASVLLLMVASLAGWWELAAHLGIGPAGLYNWISIDGLERNPDAGNWKPEKFWWWFRASRVINTFDESGVGLDFTIEEFPAFSFILGDLHPHVISIPFVITGIAAAYNLFISTQRWGWNWLKREPYAAAAIALIIGASGFINQADLLLMAAVFGGAVALKAYGESGRNLLVSTLSAAPPLAALAVAAAIVFAPFYFGTLGGQLQSPPIAPAEYGTRPVHFLTVWGIFLLVIAPFGYMATRGVLGPYVGAAWRTRARFPLAPSGLRRRFSELRYAEDDARPRTEEKPETTAVVRATYDEDMRLLDRLDRWVWITPLVLVGVPYVVWALTHLVYNDSASIGDVYTRLGTVFPLGAVFAGLLFATVRMAHTGATPARLFVLMLAAIVVYMLFGAELFFVHDLFGNRMNTVFKFYYQAWIVLSAVAGFAGFYWATNHWKFGDRARIASGIAVAVIAVLLVGPVWYSFAAGASKAGDNSGAITIDGWAFLDRFNPADAATIKFLNDEAQPGSRIVEAVGGSYSEYGRISAATGLPTIVGWEGHERQWRGSDDLFVDRAEHVRTIYETEDEATARLLLDRYDITFVVIGQRERASYTGLEMKKFDSLGAKVFDSDGTAIYDVRNQGS